MLCLCYSYTTYTVIIALNFLKRDYFLTALNIFYFMVMICHGLMGEFEVTKATVESTYILAVLSIRLTDCSLQTVQQ